MKALTALTAFTLAIAGSHAGAEAPELRYVSGLQGPEDMVRVPGTDWIVVSSFAATTTAKTLRGGLALIDPATRALTRAVIDPAARPKAPYAACASPPNLARFSAHGLDIRREADGRSTLFVVGHLGREAIEVFNVGTAGGRPALTWIGCVPAAAGAFNNSVASLADGRIFVTDFLHGGATLADLFANRTTGAVYEWRPGRTWRKLPGTDSSGANGIAVTPDSRWMFVADSGTATVRRYDLRAPGKPASTIDPGFRTDNIRWGPGGRLLIAGTRADPACKPDDQNCPETGVVKSLDPRTLQVSEVLEIPGPTFSNPSAALIVGDTLWLGSPEGDRIVYTPAPRVNRGR